MRIVRLVKDRGWFAESGQVIEFAGFDRRADLVLGDDLNGAVGESRRNRTCGFTTEARVHGDKQRHLSFVIWNLPF